MSRAKKNSEKPEELLDEEILEEAIEDDSDTEDEAEVCFDHEELKRIGVALKESNDNYMRICAEYDNYRKRTAKERDSIYPMATADTVSKFLPVLDSFERANDYEHGTEEFAKGVDLIYQNLKEILAGLGIEPVAERGAAFDPEFHNAVMHVEDSELPENSISQVLQQGYKIGDRVIRHAMVQTAN